MDIANIPVSPTSLPSIKFADNDHSMKFDDNDHYKGTVFCGLCYDNGMYEIGQRGRWLQHGDWMQNEQKWIYLCSSCQRFLWRLYSKDEGDLQDLQEERFNKDFMIFLKVELEKRRTA